MDSMNDLFKQYRPAGRQPAEVQAVKRYIYEELGAESSVSIHGNSLVVTVASAALANTLRFHIVKLREAAATDKHISFRIG